MRTLLPRWRSATLVITAVLALLAGATACSAGSKNSSSSTAGGDVAAKHPADAAGAGAGAPAGAPDQNKAGVGGNPQAAPGAAAAKPGQVPSFQRSIVYTGAITLRVPDVNAAATQLETLAATVGGFVGGDDRTIDAGRSTATLVLRIPANKFGGILDDIRTRLGGQEQSRKVSTDDVTETVIDLDARIQSQQASVDRVRALLARANSLTDVAAVESQLAQREADLESMQAQKRNLDDLTTLSTVTVSLLGPQAAAPKPKPKPEPGFWGGLKGGWTAFTGTLRVVLMVVGALLPFAVPVGAVVLLVLWLRRRRRPASPPAHPTPPVLPAQPSPQAQPPQAQPSQEQPPQAPATPAPPQSTPAAPPQ
jgi:hypothetical protein